METSSETSRIKSDRLTTSAPLNSQRYLIPAFSDVRACFRAPYALPDVDVFRTLLGGDIVMRDCSSGFVIVGTSNFAWYPESIYIVWSALYAQKHKAAT